MFGYVNINKPELRVKELGEYKAYYCGLCHALKKMYGRKGQVTLTYDMTFLVLLLSSLYESKSIKKTKRCLAHPMSKHEMKINKITCYGASMNIALTYHKLLDDWVDEKSISSKAASLLLYSDYKKVEKKYTRQCRVIETCINKLRQCEQEKVTDLDKVAGCFGTLMSEIFLMKEDDYSKYLREFGYHLGKYIYILDAYLDIEKDKFSGNYNPLIFQKERKDFEEYCHSILVLLMGECTIAFEKLPIIQNVELLRNILYAGVWVQYEKKQSLGKI